MYKIRKGKKKVHPNPNMEPIDEKLPFFCFLMITTRQQQKVNTSIEVSQKPMEYLKFFAESRTRSSSEGENNKSWKMELIIGPFWNLKDARKFRNEWKKDSRGILCRRNKGIQKAEKNGYEVYDARIVYDEASSDVPEDASIDSIKENIDSLSIDNSHDNVIRKKDNEHNKYLLEENMLDLITEEDINTFSVSKKKKKKTIGKDENMSIEFDSVRS
jgi:hypothetical protein